MERQTYFDTRSGRGWPEETWLARYFLTAQGRSDFFASGNDSWSLSAEGVDGTDHLPQVAGRVDVNLLIQGHRELGVLLQWRKTGGVPLQTYYSKGDVSRLHEHVCTANGELMPIGLFIPFKTAWTAIREFMQRDAALPACIAWIASADLPAGTFPPL